MNDEIINQENEDSFLDKDYYLIEYKGQNLLRKNSFKKWYKIQSEKIKIENDIQSKKANEYEINNFFFDDKIIKPMISFSFISLCEKCQCYSKHTLISNSIFSKCCKCNKEYCLGCSVEKYSSDNNKLCLRGYLKHLYLRMKYQKEKEKENDLEIMEYVFIFVITIIIMPIYLSLVSCFCFFNRHPNKPIDENNINQNLYFEIYKTLYPGFFSLLYFVYIISFLPILFIITLIIFLIPFLRNKFMIIYEPMIR